MISAKSGLNVRDVLEAIVAMVPPPKGDVHAPLQALVFDSLYDPYRGVIAFVSIKQGSVAVGRSDPFHGEPSGVRGAGGRYPHPKEVKKDVLRCGEVGWITAAIKDISDVHVGDTITNAASPADQALPGYRRMNPMVYCGLYPIDNAKYNDLRDALEKLKLTMLRCSLNRRPHRRSVLAFAAVFWIAAHGCHPRAHRT